MNEYQDGDYTVRDHGNGRIERFLTPPPPQPVRRIALEDFIDRFTEAELEGIQTAAANNQQASFILDYIKLRQTVNLDSPNTARILGKLVTAGLLTAERAAEVTQ